MTTLALLGLLVVLLVAIGIAAFLLRGRKRDEDGSAQAEQPAAPPRTVRDLVDHRRGLVERGQDSTPDGDDTGAVGTVDGAEDASEPDTVPSPAVGRDAIPAEAATTDTGTAPDEADTVAAADVGAGSATGSTGGPTASSTAPDTEPAPEPAPDADEPAADEPVADEPAADEPAADSAEPGPVASADAAEPVAPAASGRTDVDTGPVGPPWSRGFVDGRPIESPPPAAPRRPQPTPHARTASSGASRPAPSGPTVADDAVATGGAGSTETGSAGAAAAGAVAAGPSAAGTDPAPTAGADPDTVGTSPEDAAGEPATPRPAAPPRQESRSPVDPDLVKRVTAVPGDRSSGPRTTMPDTDTAREFREARDRISAQATTGRVPEQGGPAGTSSARRPSPVPVPERDRAGPGERRGPDTSGSSVVTGAGIVAGALGLGAAATGIAASRREDTAGTPAGTAEATGQPADPAAPTAQGAVSGAAITTEGADDDQRPRPAPPARPGGPGAPALGPTGEPAPRPTPRLMRSPAPVSGAADGPAEDGAAAEGPEPDTTPVVDPAVPEPSTSDTDPASPQEPVVAFRHRPAEQTPPPVTGTARQDVEVRVSGRDAAPVGGVAVTVLDGTGHPVGSGTTDDGGGATLRVPGAGRYVVVSSAEGYQPGVATCAVADDPARVALTVTRSAAVRGVVRAASGSPMAGVVVTLDQDGETVGRADTGSDGAFRIADLGAGYYVLAAGTGAGAASQPVRLAAEADVEQDLEIAR